MIFYLKKINGVSEKSPQSICKIHRLASGRFAGKDITNIVAHGCCNYCDEALTPALMFCGVDYRDDYDKQQAAKARAGRTG